MSWLVPIHRPGRSLRMVGSEGVLHTTPVRIGRDRRQTNLTQLTSPASLGGRNGSACFDDLEFHARAAGRGGHTNDSTSS